MSALDPAGTSPEQLPLDLQELGVFPTAAEGFERGLVVLATGHPYWLVPGETGHRLLVAPEAYEHAREQLARFEREQTRWPPPPVADALLLGRGRVVFPVGWIAVMLAAFWAQGMWPWLTLRGALDATAVVDRSEWWRVVTALFLHSDADHFLANGFAGFFLFAAVLSTIGRVRGWALLAIASATTNALLAVLSYPGPYRSLGASTMIFAALGVLTGRALRLVARAQHPHRWRAMFIPLAASGTTLALYGAGGQQVDLAAHAVGFLAGLVAGVLGAGLARAR